MKFYSTKDNKIAKAHKDLIKTFQKKSGLTDYQVILLILLKGFIIGAILL